MDMDRKMVDSGQQWIGEIPSTWKVTSLKNSMQLSTKRISGHPVYIGMENVVGSTGRLALGGDARISEDGNDGFFLNGQILFGKLRPYLRKVWLADFEGSCSTEFLVLTPNDGVDPQFAHLLLLSSEFCQEVNDGCKGVKMPRADWGSIGAIKIPLPQPSEQQAIASYLDHHTSLIDRERDLITKKIALLRDKRKALIYEVVTGKRTIVEAQTLAGDGGERLDDVVFSGQLAAVPTAKASGRLVDSGVPWIGEVPDHWTMGCFSEITKIKTGFPFSMDMASTEKLSETHLPLIKMSNFKVGQNHLNVLDNQSYFDRRIAPNHVLNHGEFIMGLSGSVENVYWHETNEEWLVNQRIAIFYKTNRYSWHLVQCPGFLSSLVDDTAGTAQVNISHLDVCKQKIAIPSISEQQLIGQYLDTATNVIDQEISLLEHKCALLSDKRKALIFEAVTGKIDLRDTANT